MSARIHLLFVSLILFAAFPRAQSIDKKIDSLAECKAQAVEKISHLQERLKELRLSTIQRDLRETIMPKLKKEETLIEHSAMMLVYDEHHEQAKWVAHKILPEIKNGGVARTDNFRPDPKVPSGTAVQEDYFRKEVHNGETIYDGYGYDRGHLAPSADFRWSRTAVSESYFYSNITPQKPELNREGWAKLEILLRDYVVENNVALGVVTGPVLSDTLDQVKRSKNGLSIPNHFYKVAYDEENQRAIAFYIPHGELQYPVSSYAVTIDSLERLTGIDFFHKLPDEQENQIESNISPAKWLTGDQKGDVPPIAMNQLSEGRVNTIKARQYMGKNKKVKVCGTVVSTHQSEDGHVFLNLDKTFPNQIFSATIWSSDLEHFHYNPADELIHEKVCLYGGIKKYEGEPSMYLQHEKQVEIDTTLGTGMAK